MSMMSKEDILDTYSGTTYYLDRDSVLKSMSEYAKQESMRVLKWLSENKQDLSIIKMNDTEIEEYYNEIINDLQSKQK